MSCGTVEVFVSENGSEKLLASWPCGDGPDSDGILLAARITAGHINELERLGMKYPYDKVRIVRGDEYAVVARDYDGKMAWGCKTHK